MKLTRAQQNMAKRNSWLLPSIVFAVCLAIVGIAYGPEWVKAATSYVSSQATATATTTVMYLGNGVGTTTYQIDGLALGKVQEMGEIDSITVNLLGAASSTGTVFNVAQQVSNNNVDWYTVNTGTSSTLLPTGVTYTWTPGTTATTGTAFVIQNVPAKHERLVFSAAAAAGAVYAEVTLKRLPTTP